MSYEELSTLLTMIEACLNSRPLSPLTADISDFGVLTPAQFLIGRSMMSLPDSSSTHFNPGFSTRWRMLVRMRDDFWELWRRTYLQSLQPRPKWLKPSPNLSVGDMVLIKQENVPPAQWPIAKVTELHPGPDGLVRTVSLKMPRIIYTSLSTSY